MNTSRTIAPINGTSPIRIHQAERPTSCRRRKPTASPGSSSASEVITDTIREPIARSTSVATTATMNANSTQYQYAEREERPLNVTYLPNPSLIASTKVIALSLLMWQASSQVPYTRRERWIHTQGVSPMVCGRHTEDRDSRPPSDSKGPSSVHPSPPQPGPPDPPDRRRRAGWRSILSD